MPIIAVCAAASGNPGWLTDHDVARTLDYNLAAQSVRTDCAFDTLDFRRRSAGNDSSLASVGMMAAGRFRSIRICCEPHDGKKIDIAALRYSASLAKGLCRMAIRQLFASNVTVLLLLIAFPAIAEDWPQWRGNHGDGVSREDTLPIYWSANSGIRWKTKLPGRGHSSPVVSNGKVFVLSADEAAEERLLICLDQKDGSIQWTRVVLESPLESIHPLNSRASSTPATDGERVFVTFLDETETLVAAYDYEGNKSWESRPGGFSSKHGFCSNPVVYEDLLIVNGDHDGDSYLVALDRETGKIVWKVPRAHKTRSYSVPRILTIDGRDQIVLTGSFATSGFDARTGELIWSVDGPSEQMVASILEWNDLIFAMGGFPEKHVLAIRKGGAGDITESHIVWRTNKAAPYVPSAVLYGDLLHVVSDDGIYTCYDPPTGDVHVRRRLTSHTSSSTFAGAGHIYVTDDQGKTTVITNSPDCEIVAVNSVGEDVYSTPSPADGTIFLRGVEHLFCIEGTTVPTSASAD